MTPERRRRPLIAGNWKMHKTVAEARAYVADLLPRLPDDAAAEVGLCVPFTALAACIEATGESPVWVGAQTMHHEHEGAFTGEVAPRMLVELGVAAVLLGHSERRQYNGETDRALQDKVPAALAAGLLPILCVGESEAEREEGETQRKLRGQVQEGLQRVPDDRLADVVIAYEPIWAIGTGKVATPGQAQEAIAFVRALVGDRSPRAAGRVRVLYGGSVKPEGVADILSLPDVDGALVGGASLDPGGFAEIVAAAQP